MGRAILSFLRMASLRDSIWILLVSLGLKSQAIACHRSAVKENPVTQACV